MGSVPTTSQAAARATPGMPNPNSNAPIVPNSSLIGHQMPTAPPQSILNKERDKEKSINDSSNHGTGYGSSRASAHGSSAMSRHNPTM